MSLIKGGGGVGDRQPIFHGFHGLSGDGVSEIVRGCHGSMAGGGRVSEIASPYFVVFTDAIEMVRRG